MEALVRNLTHREVFVEVTRYGFLIGHLDNIASNPTLPQVRLILKYGKAVEGYKTISRHWHLIWRILHGVIVAAACWQIMLIQNSDVAEAIVVKKCIEFVVETPDCLCGGSLGICKANASSKSNTAVIAGAAVVAVTLAALGFSIVMFFFVRRVSYRKKEEDPEGNKWAKSLKGAKAIKASYITLMHHCT
ncbi:hypothetical protein TSUD_354010 [Trifolium subterraneum]|uniref:Uncharacterized protein n=1 Tax=Trifolium subterraneum TaxID=3900 RepID=A0A2Z6N420_TRISU|nr:hypothetical protein TSUD_354010 [Trifolium subterraneum]